MTRLPDFTKAFARDTQGATAIEYSLIAAIVGLGIIVALFTFSGKLPNAINQIGQTIANQF